MSGQGDCGGHVVAALLATFLAAAPAAGQDLPFDPEAGIQTATAEDIRIMEPYIGTFRSPTAPNEQFGEPAYHEITYRWVDDGRTSVAVRVRTVGAESGTELSFLEGYYGFEPIEEYLFAVAVFSWGGAGLAAVGEFDHDTGHRVVHVRAPGPDGAVLHIRDVFDVVDADRWRDRTYTRVGEDGEWTQVYEDVFTRVE